MAEAPSVMRALRQNCNELRQQIMVMVSFSLREDYWDNFELKEDDIEFLYNDLLELETPLTSLELVAALVVERIRKEKITLEQQRSSGGDLYLPKENYKAKQQLVFPALAWRRGKVTDIRPGQNPDLGDFEVIKVAFENGEEREFASGLKVHTLNSPLEVPIDDPGLDPKTVLIEYAPYLVETLEEELGSNPDFVRIAGRWFPRALLVDVNVGHLNLTEAVLDMAGGGPMPTAELIKQIDLTPNANPKLVEFSLDLALQEDPRFDEVGPAGEVLWFLRRLEPPEVLEPPVHLRYSGIDYDRSLLTEDMLALEKDLDDELSPIKGHDVDLETVTVRLLYPHWASGTLPLSARLRNMFPTAYEAPRIRFMLVDGETGDKFPGWVVPEKRYVFGLKAWYEEHGLIPGSLVKVSQGNRPGEVIIKTTERRSSREWIRTVLVGSDGGIVFAMLKQIVTANFDERMAIAIPDEEAVNHVWTQLQKERPAFEQTIVNTVRELAKLNPQSHVHASELYAAVNIVRRCPPGPILSLLASRSWFVHVGDLHFRLNDSER
jgi:hypothetical protein